MKAFYEDPSTDKTYTKAFKQALNRSSKVEEWMINCLEKKDKKNFAILRRKHVIESRAILDMGQDILNNSDYVHLCENEKWRFEDYLDIENDWESSII